MSKITYYGKFQNGVGELCYQSSLDGTSEELGESEGFGWFGRLDGNFSKNEVRQALRDAGHDFNILDYSEYATLRRMAGAIVHNTNSGAVYVATYATSASLSAAWSTLEAEYQEWLGDPCTECDMYSDDCFCEEAPVA